MWTTRSWPSLGFADRRRSGRQRSQPPIAPPAPVGADRRRESLAEQYPPGDDCLAGIVWSRGAGGGDIGFEVTEGLLGSPRIASISRNDNYLVAELVRRPCQGVLTSPAAQHADLHRNRMAARHIGLQLPTDDAPAAEQIGGHVLVSPSRRSAWPAPPAPCVRVCISCNDSR